MTICIFAPNLSHALETVGFYSRMSGAEVVFATLPDGSDQGSEHPWCIQRARINYDVRSILDEPPRCDLLICDAFVEQKYGALRNHYANRSGKIAFFFPHDSTTPRMRASHFLRSWPHSLKADAIFIGERRLSIDTVPHPLQRRAFFSPYLHPQLFTDQALRNVFAIFDPTESRPYSVGFIGNRNPSDRQHALIECLRAIDQADARSRTLWIDYGDNDDSKRGLEPDQYISALGQMDFCICPVGWSKWTHRVVESLCRGAIPILQDAHLYGLGLRHGVNCLIVEGNRWFQTAKIALESSPETVANMRRNVLDLRSSLLLPSNASRRFSEQFQTMALTGAERQTLARTNSNVK